MDLQIPVRYVCAMLAAATFLCVAFPPDIPDFWRSIFNATADLQSLEELGKRVIFGVLLGGLLTRAMERIWQQPKSNSNLQS